MRIALNKHNRRILIVCLAIALTIVGRTVLTVLLFPAVILFAAAMLIGTDYENFEVGLLLIPCIRIFDKTGVTYFVNILLFFPVLVSILRMKKVHKEAFIHTALLCVLEAVHCLTLNNTGNLLPNLSAIGTLYFFEMLLRNDEKYDPINIFRWLSYGVILSAATYLIILSTRSRDILYFILRGVRFQAFANDPNYYSMYICIAIACLFASQASKWFDIVIVIADFLLGLITSSKMSLIIMIFIKIN